MSPPPICKVSLHIYRICHYLMTMNCSTQVLIYTFKLFPVSCYIKTTLFSLMKCHVAATITGLFGFVGWLWVHKWLCHIPQVLKCEVEGWWGGGVGGGKGNRNHQLFVLHYLQCCHPGTGVPPVGKCQLRVVCPHHDP